MPPIYCLSKGKNYHKIIFDRVTSPAGATIYLNHRINEYYQILDTRALLLITINNIQLINQFVSTIAFISSSIKPLTLFVRSNTQNYQYGVLKVLIFQFNYSEYTKCHSVERYIIKSKKRRKEKMRKHRIRFLNNSRILVVTINITFIKKTYEAKLKRRRKIRSCCVLHYFFHILIVYL